MQRDASLSHPARHDAAGWRRDSTVVDRLLHSSQFSCSRIESGPLRTAIVIQEQNGGNTQIERMRMMVCCRILSLWNQLPCSYVEWYSVRNETSVPARPSQREVTLCCPARRDAVRWWKDLTAEGIDSNPGPRRRSHCSAWHEAEAWRRDVTAGNRVLPMLQVSRSCVEKCPTLQLCQCSHSCVEEPPRWIESPVPSLVMQRDASLSHPARHDAAGWGRDSTVVESLLHLNQFSCSRIESGPLRTAIVIQEQIGGNTQIERMRMMVCFRILSLWNQLPCSYVERYSVQNVTPVPARASQREVTLCCPARRDAVGWWRDLTAEGIEPNPGPRRRLPAGTRRVKVWCLNVGSAVAAWETLEDAATERVELVALQEVKLNTSEYKSFDTRAAALGYACFGVPASNKTRDGREQGESRPSCQQALQIKTGCEVLELWRSGKPGLGEWLSFRQLLCGTSRPKT